MASGHNQVFKTHTKCVVLYMICLLFIVTSWSSDTNTPPQFLILKLERPSIVTSITFGKFEKAHVCNLKHFKVFAGEDDDNMIEVLDAGLKNDTVSEHFSLRHTVNTQHFPVNYVKILPLKSHGPAFNYSVWFVSLAGDDNSALIKQCQHWHREHRSVMV